MSISITKPLKKETNADNPTTKHIHIMASQITGITRLHAAMDKLKTIAEEVKENLEIKQDWLEGKTEKYQDSHEGQGWAGHISAVEDLLNDIDNLEPVDLEN